MSCFVVRLTFESTNLMGITHPGQAPSSTDFSESGTCSLKNTLTSQTFAFNYQTTTLGIICF